jgi:hypothetical protein
VNVSLAAVRKRQIDIAGKLKVVILKYRSTERYFSIVEMGGVDLTVTKLFCFALLTKVAGAAGHTSFIFRLRNEQNTSLRRSTPHESKAVCFLHLHRVNKKRSKER